MKLREGVTLEDLQNLFSETPQGGGLTKGKVSLRYPPLPTYRMSQALVLKVVFDVEG